PRSGPGIAQASVAASSRSAAPTPGERPGSPHDPVVGAPVQVSQKSPVIAASVGTHTGPIGSAIFPYVQGLQVWVRYINDRGGVNGPQVQLRIYDDGGDPARNYALTRQAVEQDHAIVFLANIGPFITRQTIDYTQSEGIPVIGGNGADQFFYEF